MGALYKGFFTSAVLSAFAIFGVTKWVLGDLGALLGGEGFLDAPSDALTGRVAAAATATTGFTGLDLFWCLMLVLVVPGLLVWQLGRAHVWTPVTNAHFVFRL